MECRRDPGGGGSRRRFRRHPGRRWGAGELNGGRPDKNSGVRSVGVLAGDIADANAMHAKVGQVAIREHLELLNG